MSKKNPPSSSSLPCYGGCSMCRDNTNCSTCTGNCRYFVVEYSTAGSKGSKGNTGVSQACLDLSKIKNDTNVSSDTDFLNVLVIGDKSLVQNGTMINGPYKNGNPIVISTKDDKTTKFYNFLFQNGKNNNFACK